LNPEAEDQENAKPPYSAPPHIKKTFKQFSEMPFEAEGDDEVFYQSPASESAENCSQPEEGDEKKKRTSKKRSQSLTSIEKGNLFILFV